ncbi:MAG: hypothetical protein IPH13_22015 [Planctomycetes bacterium]|nr:hypothetical protein [Planctomycetota bacterium]MCC7169459.1 hypothetical protein [Planctomycetota bacterium]
MGTQLIQSGVSESAPASATEPPVAAGVSAEERANVAAADKEEREKIKTIAEKLRSRRLDFFSKFRIRGTSTHAMGDEMKRTAAANRARIDRMFGDERAAILAACRDERVGLALSGGGIRSASFAGGVLQGLHEIDVLDKFGYLSTVSGGGYVGAWWMLHSGIDEHELFDMGSLHQQHLGQNGFFLTVGHYSQSRAAVVFDVLRAAALVPVHWIANGLVDSDVNVGGLRDGYRNGIVRAFMYRYPMSEVVSPRARASMRGLLPQAQDGRSRPYWIVNTHLALNDESTSYRARSGDAFEITPFRAGSDLVGYVSLEEFDEADAWFGDSERDWMTPEYAVAASGAAADSSSLRASTWVNLLMTAFNLDLGYYISGWSDGFVAGDRDLDREPRPVAANNIVHWAVSPGLVVFNLSDAIQLVGSLWGGTSFAGLNSHEQTVDAKKWYLSDGGHFENLGVYALVKRGCRVIVVSDATMDPNANTWHTSNDRSRSRLLAFEDLRNLEAKLFADFGAELEIEWERFDPKCTDGEGPTGCVFLGRIDNLPVDDGCDADRVVIVYIKSAYELADGQRSRQTFIDAHKERNRDFPNDSTLQQFYSEEKVLSYRALGRAIVLANRELIRAATERRLNGCKSFKEMRSVRNP